MTVNVPKGFIIHHLELSAFPNWVGTDQKRYFEFSGDRLTLKTPPLTLSGRDQVHRLIWKRLDRENRLPQKPMSALPLKADVCRANRHVCFGPKADTVPLYSITSSARPIKVLGTVMPSALAVLRFMMSSTLVACCTGRSAGLSPLRTRPV